MNNAIKNYNSFATAFNKSVEESNKTEHPSSELINLFAMNALPKEKMDALKEHLEYCWHCGDVLADAEEFQEISDNIDAGVLKVNVKIPSFEELKERAFGKPENLLGKASAVFTGFFEKISDEFLNLINQNYVLDLEEGAPDKKQTLILELCGKILHFYFEKEGLDVYSPDSDLVGKFLTFKTLSPQNDIKSKFIKDETREGMKVSTFLRLGEKGKDLLKIENLGFED